MHSSLVVTALMPFETHEPDVTIMYPVVFDVVVGVDVEAGHVMLCRVVLEGGGTHFPPAHTPAVGVCGDVCA